MKIAGQEVNSLNEDVLVIPRGANNIIFKGRAVPNFDYFNKLVPQPEPPGMLTRKGYVRDEKDPTYLQVLNHYHLQRMAYLAVMTLQPSEIEWDTVRSDDPTSWENWVTDLSKSGFTAIEQQKILDFVLQVNCLDESKLERARADFLRGQGPEQSSS